MELLFLGVYKNPNFRRDFMCAAPRRKVRD